MKKFLIFVFLVILGIGGFIGGRKIYSNIKEQKRIEEAKKGWYLEVLVDNKNVREDHLKSSNKIGTLHKGDIYAVLDFYTKDVGHYWYQIQLTNGEFGWVSNPKDAKLDREIKDYNGTEDVATPTLKYNDTAKCGKDATSNNCYRAFDIDHITTDHLIIWDDRDDYVISWVVYHEVVKEELKDQYWIEWKVTDGSGKSASKVQKIAFEERPAEERVVDWFERKK